MIIKNCKQCGSEAYVKSERRSPSRNQGNGYHKPMHDFYVCCKKCMRMGPWIKSNSAKAISLWNKENL